MTPLQLKEKLRRQTLSNLQKKVSQIITKDKKILALKIDELDRGEKPDGSPIGEYSSPSYALFKGSTTVNLILSGDFSSAIRPIYLGNGSYSLMSSDEKRPALIAKYGISNEYLNEEDWVKLQRDVYAPQLLKMIKRDING